MNVIDLGDGTYDIEYTPKELGVYNLDVTFDGVPVPGSPFKFKVVEPGPQKVKVYGPGMAFIFGHQESGIMQRSRIRRNFYEKV